MTTFIGLRTLVSRDLADPNMLTFDVDAVSDFIAQGLAALARVAPQQYTEDLDPNPNQFSYPLRASVFTTPQPELRLVRAEVWAGTPSRFAFKLKAKAGTPSRDSIAGWEVWAGTLEVPQQDIDAIMAYDPNAIIRVWGYSPYIAMVADGDTVPVSAELELALRTFCRVEGLRRLTSSRVLFKQWQARSSNTDVTIANLNSDLQVAEEQWHRLKRELKVPEQNPD